MLALEQPYVPSRAGLLDGTPVAALAMLAAAWGLALLALPAAAARGVGLAAAHCALLGAALAWTAPDPRRVVGRVARDGADALTSRSTPWPLRRNCSAP